MLSLLLPSGCGSNEEASSNLGPGEGCLHAASSETRPQLSEAEAAVLDVHEYLAQAGRIGALTVDSWDPTAGLPAAETLTPDFTVAADGSGTHTTVQAAISASGGPERRYILIKPGTYRETVTILSAAPPLTLYGLGDASEVTIVEGKSAETAGGTSGSATFTVKSTGFQALNLTISNDFPTPTSGSGLQAVALHTQGDQTVLQNVVLHGFQDTLYLDSTSDSLVARVYIKDSLIEGDTDFIFGRATAVLEDCTIRYLASRRGTSSGIVLESLIA